MENFFLRDIFTRSVVERDVEYILYVFETHTISVVNAVIYYEGNKPCAVTF